MHKAQRLANEALRQPIKKHQEQQQQQLKLSQDAALAAAEEAVSLSRCGGFFPPADKRQLHQASNYFHSHHQRNHEHQHHQLQRQHHHRDHLPFELDRRYHQKQFIQHPQRALTVREPLRQQQSNTNSQHQRRIVCKKQSEPSVSRSLESVQESVQETDAADKENQVAAQVKPCLDRAAMLPMDVPDIDRNGHCMMVSAYAKDIFVYLAERELHYSLPEDFLAGQTEVNERSRAVVVDWLLQLSSRLELQADTYHLGVRLLDHYLATDRSVTRRQLQLLSATALWLASKFEEVYCISVSDLLHVCAGACTRRDLLAMEVRLVGVLDFHLLPPLPITFLRRLSKVAGVDNRLHYAAKYLLELATLSARLAWRPASLLAAAAMRVAIGSEGRDWSDLLVFYSGYGLSSLRSTAAELARACASAAATASLTALPDTGGSNSSSGGGDFRYQRFVFQKYRSPKCFGVAACPQFGANSQYLAELIDQDASPAELS